MVAIVILVIVKRLVNLLVDFSIDSRFCFVGQR